MNALRKEKSMKCFISMLLLCSIVIAEASSCPKQPGVISREFLACELIKTYEGKKLDKDGNHVVYTCPSGVLTIGYGETAKAVVDKKIISEAEATDLLSKRVTDLDQYISKKVKVQLTEYQRAALISFVYNVGKGNFESSTLLKELNKGNYNEVPAQLNRWVYSKGKILQGLVNRRNAEIKIWNLK